MPHFESPRSLDILMAADDRLRSISHHGKLTVSCSSLNATWPKHFDVSGSCFAACLGGGWDGWCFHIHENGNKTILQSSKLAWQSNGLPPPCLEAKLLCLLLSWNTLGVEMCDCPTFFKTHFIFTLSLYFSYGIFACGCVSKVWKTITN